MSATEQTITQEYVRGYEDAKREFEIYLNKITLIFFIIMIVALFTSVLVIVNYNNEKKELYEYVKAEKEILIEKQRLFDTKVDMFVQELIKLKYDPYNENKYYIKL
jgi:hypothetical protein